MHRELALTICLWENPNALCISSETWKWRQLAEKTPSPPGPPDLTPTRTFWPADTTHFSNKWPTKFFSTYNEQKSQQTQIRW